MRRAVKATLLPLLAPVAHVAAWAGLSVARLFRIARMRAAGMTVPASAVVLGPVSSRRARVTFGENILIYGYLHLESNVRGCEIRVGDDSVLASGVHLVAFADIDIGDRVMIGEFSSVRSGDHRYGPAIQPRRSGHDQAPIIIEDDAWIGRGVIITPGVTIGAGAVVGANSVVTHDVGPGQVVVGAPARPVERDTEAVD